MVYYADTGRGAIGSALAWGARGWKFKSSRSDNMSYSRVAILFNVADYLKLLDIAAASSNRLFLLLLNLFPHFDTIG